MTLPFYIHEGATKVSIEITEEKKEYILDRIMQYCQEHECFIGEVLHQDDDCIIDAPNVLSDIIDKILQPEVTNV